MYIGGDPYLYDDVDILKNLADIKDRDLLGRAEADITNLSMLAVYNQSYNVFDTYTPLERATLELALYLLYYWQNTLALKSIISSLKPIRLITISLPEVIDFIQDH